MPDETTRPTASRGGVVVLAVLLGLLFGLGGLGSTALAVVLTDVGESLGVSVGQATWLITLYALGMAVSAPVYGRLVDIVGVRLPLACGVSLMALGALVTASSADFTVAAVARLAQGLGTGVGVTLAVAVMGTRYHGSDRSRGMAIIAGITGAIAAVGPFIGAVTDFVLSWRGTAALPALAIILLVALWPRIAGPGGGGSFDIYGAVLVSITAAGVIMVLQSPATGWAVALVGLVLVVVGLPLVMRHSRRGRHVFLPQTVLRLKILVVCLVGGTVPAAWFALLVAVPAGLAALGWQPVAIGVALLPTALFAVLAPILTSRVSQRFGETASLGAAAMLAGVSALVAGLGVFVGGVVPMVAGIAIVSVAFALGQPAMFGIVSQLAAGDVRGTAMGFATLGFLTCGSAGSAVVGALTTLAGLHVGLLALGVLCGGSSLLLRQYR